jgi:outer membrane protein TolC
MHPWTYLLAVLGALGLLGVDPRPARADVVSLPELTQRALAARPGLAAGSARTRAARHELERAQSAYHPRLSLEAQSSIGPGRELIELEDDDGNTFLVQGARPFGERGTFTPVVRNELGLELRGNVYDFGRTSTAVDAGRAAHASAQADEDVAREAVVQAVQSAYLVWLGQHALQGLAEQTADDAAQRRARVQALIDEGARPAAELSIARTDEMLAALELERARGELRAAKLALEHVVGSPLAPDAEPDASLLDADDSEPQASTADATLRALALKHQAATAEARRLERADAPLLAGAISAGLRSQDIKVFPGYGVGLSFSMPLLDGGGSEAQAQAARARADAIAAELEDQRQGQQHTRARAQLDRDNALARLSTAEALLEVVRQRVRDAEQAYELGASGLEALADARSLLRRAESEVVHAKLARASAALRLRAR